MSIREKILDAAEARMRAVGYNATSFRDVASDVGVKSASVHYHFPQKEDLGAALMERYTKRQFETLEAATDGISDPAARIEALITLHSDAFAEGERICLCAMLSAESISFRTRSLRQHSASWTAVSPGCVTAFPETRVRTHGPSQSLRSCKAR